MCPQVRLFHLAFCVVLTPFAVAPAVMAQEYSESLVVADGEATIDAEPGFVEFVLRFRGVGETNTAAMQKVKELEAQLREEAGKLEFAQPITTFTGPAVPDAVNNVAVAHAKLRFDASIFRVEGQPGDQLAKLSDAVAALAKQVQATVDGPRYGVDDPISFEQQAVKSAIENAYFPAEASAQTLRAEVTSVATVEILELVWRDGRTDPEAALPNPEKMQVIGRVRVTYTVAPNR